MQPKRSVDDPTRWGLGVPTAVAAAIVPIQVLLVDDEQVIRRLQRMTLESVPLDFVVAGEAADGDAGLVLWRALRPDVTILDQNMPGLRGIDLARRILTEAPTAKLLLCTGLPDLVATEAGLLGVPVTNKSELARLPEFVRNLAGPA